MSNYIWSEVKTLEAYIYAIQNEYEAQLESSKAKINEII